MQLTPTLLSNFWVCHLLSISRQLFKAKGAVQNVDEECSTELHPCWMCWTFCCWCGLTSAFVFEGSRAPKGFMFMSVVKHHSSAVQLDFE